MILMVNCVCTVQYFPIFLLFSHSRFRQSLHFFLCLIIWYFGGIKNPLFSSLLVSLHIFRSETLYFIISFDVHNIFYCYSGIVFARTQRQRESEDCIRKLQSVNRINQNSGVSLQLSLLQWHTGKGCYTKDFQYQYWYFDKYEIIVQISVWMRFIWMPYKQRFLTNTSWNFTKLLHYGPCVFIKIKYRCKNRGTLLHLCGPSWQSIH